ncbi:hypothetical protein AAVH_17811 [Aphelenchoides avenae]|nr:hypothetical protein AAVH_17811 [Aphelenchus avenae]
MKCRLDVLFLDKERLVLAVLHPHFNDTFLHEIEKSGGYYSVGTDGSTHKKVRLYAITVRYFNENGVNCRLLDLAEMVSETAVDMVGLLCNTLKACVLDEQKMIGFTADNTNSNSGGENRAGQNNVYAILTRETRAQIIGIGCSSHIAHNAAKFGCDKMDVDF